MWPLNDPAPTQQNPPPYPAQQQQPYGAPPPGYTGPPPGYEHGGPPPGYGSPPSGPPPGYGYGPPPYATQGYGYVPYMMPIDHPNGTLILILGIVGLVACQIIGPVAWIMGSKALREIDANRALYRNRGNVQAGRICGIIGTCLLVAGIAFYVLILVAFSQIEFSTTG